MTQARLASILLTSLGCFLLAFGGLQIWASLLMPSQIDIASVARSAMSGGVGIGCFIGARKLGRNEFPEVKSWRLAVILLLSILGGLALFAGGVMFLASLLAIDSEDVVPPSWYLVPTVTAAACLASAIVLARRGRN